MAYSKGLELSCLASLDCSVCAPLNTTTHNQQTNPKQNQPQNKTPQKVIGFFSCVPKTIKYNSAFVFVDGGHITDPPPKSVYPLILMPVMR